VTAILHASGPVRYWVTTSPGQPALLAADIEGRAQARAGLPRPVRAALAHEVRRGRRDPRTSRSRTPWTLTPDPGRALDIKTSPSPRRFPGLPRPGRCGTDWEPDGRYPRSSAATGAGVVLPGRAGCDFRDPRISPDGRLVACRRCCPLHLRLPANHLVVTRDRRPPSMAPRRRVYVRGPARRPSQAAWLVFLGAACPPGQAQPPGLVSGGYPPPCTGGRVTPGAITDLLERHGPRPLEAAWARTSGSLYFHSPPTTTAVGPCFPRRPATGEITR